MTLEIICRPIHSGSSQNPVVGFQHVYIFIAMHVTPINHSLFQSWNPFCGKSRCGVDEFQTLDSVMSLPKHVDISLRRWTCNCRPLKSFSRWRVAWLLFLEGAPRFAMEHGQCLIWAVGSRCRTHPPSTCLACGGCPESMLVLRPLFARKKLWKDVGFYYFFRFHFLDKEPGVSPQLGDMDGNISLRFSGELTQLTTVGFLFACVAMWPFGRVQVLYDVASSGALAEILIPIQCQCVTKEHAGWEKLNDFKMVKIWFNVNNDRIGQTLCKHVINANAVVFVLSWSSR